MRKVLALVIAVVVAVPVLVVDPAGWFDDSELRWHYGEAEMRAAIEGTWELTVDGTTWKLALRQGAGAARSERASGLVRSATACGSRSFVRSAHACANASFMPVEVSVLGRNQPAFGLLLIDSTVFERGHLQITIGADSDHRIAGAHAIIDPRGTVLETSHHLVRTGTTQRDGGTVTPVRTRAPR